MNKAAHKYIERRMAEFAADVLELYRLAQPILAKSDSPAAFRTPISHYQHQGDIIAELVRVSPAIVGEVTLLRELEQHAQAATRLKDALLSLRQTDPALFLAAPSPRLCAFMMVGANASPDTWASAISSATYATTDARRRTVLPIRRAMIASGQTPHTEDDIADLMLASRDEAIAEQHRAGGGVKATRRT